MPAVQLTADLPAAQLQILEQIDATWTQARRDTVRFQLLATAILTLAVLVGTAFTLPTLPFALFLLALGWVALSTLILTWLLTRTRAQQRVEHWSLRLGLFVSVLTITFLTDLVGRADGDFYLIYFLPLLTAGIYFGLRGALIVASASGLSYFALAYLTVGLTPDLLVLLAVRIAFLFLLAGLLGFLVEGQQLLLTRLRQAYTQAAELAFVDPLTGIGNRRWLLTRLDEEIERAQRSDSPVALLLVDVDHFKRYNDTLGHGAGDQALRAIAALLRSESRSADFAGRLGGDEFALVLPQTAAPEAQALADRLCSVIAAQFPAGPLQPSLSVTLGIAVYPEHAQSMAEVFERADQALYRAKAAGRNAAVVWAG